MKIYILCCLLLTFLSCTNEQKSKKSEPSELKREQVNKNEKIAKDQKIDAVAKYGIYNGSWFSIEYPKQFSKTPVEPKGFIADYNYVKTDEANFSNENGEVEFFVYSPQWGGDPKTYLNASDKEKVVSRNESKKIINQEGFESEKITKWITFKDVSGSYTRSVVSIKTENTHLVFGYKYKDLETYNKYKEDYLRFKKSLIQYAD